MLRDDLVPWILIYFLQSEAKPSWDLGAVLDFEHPGFHKAQKRAMVTKKRRRRGRRGVGVMSRGAHAHKHARHGQHAAAPQVHHRIRRRRRLWKR